MKRIAFFDFDGTITTRDTLLEFIKFTRGKSCFYTGFFLCSPYILAFKLGIISNQQAKERVLRFFFGGMTEDLFNNHCRQFYTQRLPSLIRPKASAALSGLAADSFEIVIVSASPGNWIRPWTSSNQYRLIATELVVENGRITGKISGRNCHGVEKVRRIREAYDLGTFAEIFAYGDSAGDRPMLEIANKAFFKPFR